MKINNSKCLIIAEIGLNHNGDHQSACDSVLAAVNSRLDAVKFQNFITEDFLIYSKSVGNDLSTPIPEYNFFGLSEGVSWCLCAARW